MAAGGLGAAGGGTTPLAALRGLAARGLRGLGLRLGTGRGLAAEAGRGGGGGGRSRYGTGKKAKGKHAKKKMPAVSEVRSAAPPAALAPLPPPAGLALLRLRRG